MVRKVFYSVNDMGDKSSLLTNYSSLADYTIKPREIILAVVDVEEIKQYVTFQGDKIHQETKNEQLCVLIRNTSFIVNVHVKKGSLLVNMLSQTPLNTFVCRAQVKNWTTSPNNETFTHRWVVDNDDNKTM